MNCKIKKAWMLIAGVLSIFVAQAKINFTDLTDNYELSATAAQATTQFRANSGLTLKLADAATDGTFEIKSSFYIPEGLKLTFNVPEGVTGVKIRMKGGLRGTGTVVFGAGIMKLTIGAVADKSNILGGVNSMPAIESDIAFAETTGRVELTEGVSLVRWPTCHYTIAAGTIVAAMGANLFDCDTLTLDQGWDLMVNATDAIKPGCKIVVPRGRTLYHRTTRLYAVSTTGSGNTSLQSWNGGTGGDINTISMEIQEGGRFEAQSKTDNNKIVGEISGFGVIAIANPGSLIFNGLINFGGTISLTGMNADDYCAFKTAAGSSLADATINFGSIASTLRLEPTVGSTLEIGTVAATGAPTIDVLSAATVDISTLNGVPLFSGHGKGTKVVVPSTYAVSAIPQGLTLSATVTDGQTVTLAGEGSENPFFGLENRGETPVSVNLAATNIGANGELELGGKLSVGTLPSVATVTILADADVKASIPSTMKIYNAGGSLELVESWKTKAVLWTDATLATSFTSAKSAMSDRYGLTDPSLAYLKDAQVAEWRDCRADHQEYRIRTTVFDGSSAAAPTSNSAKSFPYLQEQDGKPSAYFSTDGARARMYIIATGVGVNTTLPVKCAVFAFNGALGGGHALFWEKDNSFKRVETVGNAYPTKDAPLVYSNVKNLSFRQDGAVVADCTQTGLKAGWQILAFTCEDGISIGALGPGKSENTGSCNGGQIFGEVIFFTEMPTTDEILAMEKYLADKWNVTIAHGGVPQSCSVSGEGTVKLATDMTLDTSCYYQGTLDLGGRRLEIGTVNLPFKAAEIPAKNRILWVDPSLAGAVVGSDDPAKADEVKMIYCRDNNGLKEADGDYYLTSPYMEGIENTNNNRRVRFTGGWLDFRNGYTADDTRGNMLFMRKLPFAQMPLYTSAAEEINVAAGFFALDSSCDGGGSLMTSAANGTTRLIQKREVSASAPIWALEKESTMTVDTRLNGETVAMTDSFSGGKDVMSFNVNGEESAPVKCFGYANPGSRLYNNNEILGEWLLYSANVPAADRERIEAYLSWKWRGVMLDGFSETRDLTVSGAGVIAVANAASLPKLGTSFTGTVELMADRYAFTLQKDATKVVEVIEIESTVSLPAQVTIDLDLTSASSGEILLMSFGTVASETSFTLGTVTNPRNKPVKLVVHDGKVYADIGKNGLLMIVK